MTKQILLIDDDEDEIDILTDAIKQTGKPIQCLYEKDPVLAIARLEHLQPDYIFVDYNMPKINGLECLAEIRKIGVIQKVPVILYSSNITEDVRMKATALGAAACIEKSFSLPSLTRNILKIIDNY
ncbi:MAG: response regulator [Chitinophagaceae bacterium]|nr:response regulator [Chitinophagaceae bacterium]